MPPKDLSTSAPLSQSPTYTRSTDAPKADISLSQYAQVPIIDAAVYLDKQNDSWLEECQKVADSLHRYGIIILRDPRATEQENEDYLSLMEKYFDTVS